MIFDTCIDGWIFDSATGDWVNTTGFQVGHLQAPFAEQSIVRSGEQSMPLYYDNPAGRTAQHGEAVRTFESPQDWIAYDITCLSLWFHGRASNGGQLYVKIDDAKVLYDGDPADLARTEWQVWNNGLAQVGPVDQVRSLTIGIEGNNVKGLLYIDDICLTKWTPTTFGGSTKGRTIPDFGGKPLALMSDD